MKITNSYEYQKLRGLKRKLHLIEIRGGCCEICGYNKNISAFEFHHRDPNDKEHQLDIRKLSNSSMSWVMKEFSKCDLLCSNCHREIHSPHLGLDEVKNSIKILDENVLKSRTVNRPKCIDCGCEINYTHKRCKPCNDLNKRIVVRPDINDLIEELNNHTQEWCAKKYGVSRSTIRRWVKNSQSHPN
jgi:hypothetical protein